MHAGRNYSAAEVFRWTRRELLVFVVWSAVPPLLLTLDFELVLMPWSPVAVLGTAVAFVTGFRSNAAYGRLWEARQVWGAIVNLSRAFAVQARDFVEGGEAARPRRLVLRHVAWLTALRHQLRQPRAWETQGLRFNSEYRARTFAVPEQGSALEAELAPLLSEEELQAVLKKKNRALAVLSLQSEDLQRAAREGQLSDYRRVELSRAIAGLLDQQGKCERIKNFPYPRQFATLNRFFVKLFIVLLPFGVTAEVLRLAPGSPWLALPMSVVLAWVLNTMDKIGVASENPFEGGPNDVPITAMSRSIEIDLLDLLNEPRLPAPVEPTHDILM